MNINSILRHLLVLILLTTASQNYASALFDDDSIIDVQLQGQLSTLLRHKKNSAELPFVLTADGLAHDVQIRLRGHSRLDVCKFPPLRINFKKSKTKEFVFAGQDKLKLVTHCSKHKSSQANLLQEYLAYKIFNQLSDVSYRVRLLRITYLDSDAGDKATPLIHYAFFIESANELAERTGAKLVEVKGMPLRSVIGEDMTKVYIFQYLIGNTDWSLATADKATHCCHNGELMDIGDKRFYIPYDFDLSGLVNARYAYPDSSLRIKRVSQRLYRGFCTSPDILKTALQQVKDQEMGILDLLKDLKSISPKEMQMSEKFLKGFFLEASDEAKILRNFERRCL